MPVGMQPVTQFFIETADLSTRHANSGKLWRSWTSGRVRAGTGSWGTPDAIRTPFRDIGRPDESDDERQGLAMLYLYKIVQTTIPLPALSHFDHCKGLPCIS